MVLGGCVCVCVCVCVVVCARPMQAVGVTCVRAPCNREVCLEVRESVGVDATLFQLSEWCWGDPEAVWLPRCARCVCVCAFAYAYVGEVGWGRRGYSFCCVRACVWVVVVY